MAFLNNNKNILTSVDIIEEQRFFHIMSYNGIQPLFFIEIGEILMAKREILISLSLSYEMLLSGIDLQMTFLKFSYIDMNFFNNRGKRVIGVREQ